MAEGLYIYHEGHEQEHQQVMRGLKEAADMIVNVNGRMKALHDGLKGAGFAGQAQGMHEWATLAREATRSMNALTEALKKNAEAARGAATAGEAQKKTIAGTIKEFAEAWKTAKDFTEMLKAVSGVVRGLGTVLGGLGGGIANVGKGIRGLGAAFGGWTAVINVAVTAIVLWGDKLFSAGKVAEDIAKINKKYADSIKEINRESEVAALQEQKRLEVLYKIAQDTTRAMNERLEAAKEMQKLAPETLGNLEREAILEGRVSEAVKEGTKQILIKARARAAAARVDAAAATEFDVNEQYEKAKKAAEDYGNWLRRYVPAIADEMAYKGWVSRERIIEILDEGRAGVAYQELKLNTYQNLIDTEAELRKKLDEARKKTKKEAEQAEEFTLRGTAAALTDGSVAKLRQEIALLKEKEDMLVDNSEEQKAATSKRIELEDRLDKILKRRKGKKDGPDKFGSDKFDPTNETLAAQARVTKAIAERNKIVLEDEIKTQQLIYDNEQESVTNRLLAFQRLQHAKAGLLEIDYNTETEITKQKLAEIAAIEKKADKDRTNEDRKLLLQKLAFQEEHKTATKKYLSELKELYSASDKEMADREKEIAKELEDAVQESIQRGLAITNRGLKEYEEAKKIEIELTKKTEQAKLETIKAGAEAAEDIARGLAESRQADLDKEIERINAKKDAEIQAIQDSSLSENEKKNRARIAEREAQRQTEELERKKVDIQRRVAVFEKATTVAKIFSDTQQKVAAIKAQAALLAGNPATAPYAAGTYALATYTQIQGALAAAAVLAQPLPQYFVGTEGTKKDEIAWTGEKGTEAIITPDGKLSFTPNQATLTYLEKGTRVIPHEETKALVAMSSSLGMSPANMAMLLQRERGGQMPNNKELISEIQSLKQAIADKQENQWFFKNGELRQVVKRGNSRIEYLGKHIFD